MNAFLVVLRCQFDDLPLAIFCDRDAAIEYAKKQPLTPPKGHLFDPSMHEGAAITVVAFKKGKPFKQILVKEE